MSDRRVDERPAVTAKKDMLAIVVMWPHLVAALPNNGKGQLGGRVSGTREPIMPIRSGIHGLIDELDNWAIQLGRSLIDDTGWTPPRDQSTRNLIRVIATSRIGHFTKHKRFINDCATYRDRIHYAIEPSLAHAVPLHCQCVEVDAENRPCPGEYVGLITEDGNNGDMVCKHDRTHIITYVEWKMTIHVAERRGTTLRDELLRGRRVNA